MKCISPVYLSVFDCKGRKRLNRFFVTRFKYSDGRISDHFGTLVPCGQCIACRLNYAKFWSIRMMQELKHHDKACFATLTYDNEHVPEKLIKKDLQDFWKRLRKERSVRYFCCGEYGDTFKRPHYHAIIYGVSPDEVDLIQKYWQKGFIKLGTVTPDSCNYVAKYMTKKLRGKALEEKLQQDPTYQNEFVLMSRRPGIGGELDEEMEKFIKETGFVYRKGFRSGLPRYYRDKYDIHKDVLEEVDYDDFHNLTLIEKKDKLIRKGLEFFKC